MTVGGEPKNCCFRARRTNSIRPMAGLTLASSCLIIVRRARKHGKSFISMTALNGAEIATGLTAWPPGVSPRGSFRFLSAHATPNALPLVVRQKRQI